MTIGDLSPIDLEVVFRLTAKSEGVHIEQVQYSANRFFVRCALFVQIGENDAGKEKKVTFEISVKRTDDVEALKNAMIIGTFEAFTKRK